MGHRNENVYTIDISKYEGHNRCFSNMHDESWLRHRRLGHVNMNLITQLSKNELVRGLPKIYFEKDKVCEACQMGKQIKTSFKNKNFISTGEHNGTMKSLKFSSPCKEKWKKESRGGMFNSSFEITRTKLS